MIAKANDQVKVHYKGTLKNGDVFDSSEGKDPLAFKLGAGQIIPGLEKGIIGMKLDEAKTINVPVDEAYGQPNPDLIHEVDKTKLPPDIEPKVGMQLVSQAQDGRSIPLVVTEVKESTIMIDSNHPLAGNDLTFEVTLVGIN